MIDYRFFIRASWAISYTLSQKQPKKEKRQWLGYTYLYEMTTARVIILTIVGRA